MNSRLKKTITLSIMFSIIAIKSVYATDVDTSIEGFTELTNFFKVWMSGVGAIVLMVSAADFFLSLSYEGTDRLVRAMQIMGAGCFLIISNSIVQAISKADGTETFQMLFGMVALIVSFIGVVLAALGGYNTFNSIKDANPEARNRGIKVLFSGLMLIAISQSVSNFII